MKRVLLCAGTVLLLLSGWIVLAAVEMKNRTTAHTISDRHQAEYFKASDRVRELQPMWDAAQKDLTAAITQITADCGEWKPDRGPDGFVRCKEPEAKKEPTK